MTRLKNKLLSLIKDGSLCCWDCKKPVNLKNVVMVNFDEGIVGYICEDCNKHDGVRTFKSIGFDLGTSDISDADVNATFLIVANGNLINPNVLARFALDMVSSIISGSQEPRRMPRNVKKVDIPVKGKIKYLDIEKLPVCDGYKKSLLQELEVLKKDLGENGVDEFWRSFYEGAARKRMNVVNFIKMCEKEFLDGYK